jgi:hypothetical protein
MPTYTFRGYPATARATFTCSVCGKENRKRTFRHECTVNPYNKNDDGMMRTPAEVFRQSADKANKERDEFLREPICKSCDRALSYTDRKELHERRKSLASA